MVELGVNIDHVATLRQARRTYEPDPVWAAAEAELGGADGITVHLREDRRHINDRDVTLLRQSVQCKLNLEMSLTPEIVRIAVATRPHQATLVPEKREEVTTEGGLDLRAARNCGDAVKQLKDAGVFVSAFLDPDRQQIELAAKLGIPAIPLGDEHHALGYQGMINMGESILAVLQHKKFHQDLAAHVRLPYRQWWLEQADPFLLARETAAARADRTGT